LKGLIALTPLLLIIFLTPMTHEAASPVTVSASNLSLTFQSESHQLASPNCYNAQIHVLAVWNGTGTSTVSLPSFYLYATGTNLVLSNSTNYQQPNNQLGFFVLFPNVPVGLVLSFTKFCIPAGLSNLQVWLFYFDGTITLKVQIV